MKTIENFDLKGKKVIIRVDFNVPIKNGVITDDNRIKESLKTINYAISNGAKVILLSHLGRIKEEADLAKNTLLPVSKRLEELLNKKVVFVSKTRGLELENAINSMQPGDVILVENTRYEDLDGKKESGNDPLLGKYWASLGDIFINDAFGTSHRAHASNVGIASNLPSGIGFLVQKELDNMLPVIKNPEHPFTVIMGGAKVDDTIGVIDNLINKCDYLLIGGGMAYTFLKASGIKIGKSIVDEESLDFCQSILEKYSDKVVLPIDHVVACDADDRNHHIVFIGDTKSDEMGFDIGPQTVDLFCQYLKNSKRVIINGPMGFFEHKYYQNGTKSIYDFIVSHHIETLIGGGDSASSVHQLSDEHGFYHISTGGGATLEYLEGKVLPGIEVIHER